MSKTDNFVFKGLIIVAWIIFVGLCIESGALIVNFIYSIFKPEIISKLYQKLDLSEMHQKSKFAFYSMYSLILAISIMKAVLFYTVVILVTKFNLSKPFNEFVSKKISQISYFTCSIGFLSYIAQETTRNLTQHGFDVLNLGTFWGDSQAFILMGAVIYMIAVIFKKGIELQNENDLTV
jgi:hypothetical protein